MARQTVPAWILAILISICCYAAAGDDLLEAVRKGDTARVKTLLDQGTDVNSKSPYGATALFFAADRGNIEMIKILLDRGADIHVKDTFYGATAVTWAVMKQRVDVLKLLLGKGAKGADEVLDSGVESGNIDMVRVALEHKADIPADSLSSALVQAEKGKHPEIVDLLRNAGIQPPARPKFEIDADTLKSYAGSYSMEGFELKFGIMDRKLNGGPVGQKAEAWDAIDRTTFQHSQYPALKLTFNIEDAKVVSLTIKRGDDKPQLFKRVAAQ